MNWTGGNLSRHAQPKANAQKAIQKQKFARNSLLRKGYFKKSSAKVPLSKTWIGKEPVIPEARSWEFEGSGHNYDDLSRTSVHPTAAFAIPPQGPESRKRLRSPDLPIKAEVPCSGSLSHHMDPSVSQKRQELLRRGDWLNLDVQAKVDVKFNTAQENQNIGKRRRIHGTQRANLHQRVVQTASRPIRYSDRDVHGNLLQRRQETQIRIGNHDLTPSVQSDILQFSPLVRRVTRPTSQSSRELMLLDQGEELRCFEDPFNERNLWPDFRSNSQDVMLLDQVEGFRGYQDGLGMFSESVYGYDSRKVSEHASDSMRKQENENIISHSRAQRNINHITESPESASTNVYSGPNYPKHRVFEYHSDQEPQTFTSTSEIIQPTPIRAQIPQVLQSSSSYGDEDLGSELLQTSPSGDVCTTAAEVGRVEPSIPSSQKLDHETWRSWLDLDAVFDESHDIGNLDVDVDITPGVSEMEEASRKDRDPSSILEPEQGENYSPLQTLRAETPAAQDSLTAMAGSPVFKRPNKIWDKYMKTMAELDEKYGPLNYKPDETNTKKEVRLAEDGQKEHDEVNNHSHSSQYKIDVNDETSASHNLPQPTNNETKSQTHLTSIDDLRPAPPSLQPRFRLIESPEPWNKFIFDANLSSNSPPSSPPVPNLPLLSSSSLLAHAFTSAVETTSQSVESLLATHGSGTMDESNCPQSISELEMGLGSGSRQATHGSELSSLQPATPTNSKTKSKLTFVRPKPYQAVQSSSPDPLGMEWDTRIGKEWQMGRRRSRNLYTIPSSEVVVGDDIED